MIEKIGIGGGIEKREEEKKRKELGKDGGK